MFDFDKSIHIVVHVLIEFRVENLLAWWNSIYAISLIMSVSMRCQLSWLDSNVLSDVFIQYGDLISHYIVRGDDH